jgi:hypothetical protein
MQRLCLENKGLELEHLGEYILGFFEGEVIRVLYLTFFDHFRDAKVLMDVPFRIYLRIIDLVSMHRLFQI